MLAYWMATGSGKTIVMHLNILQYLTYIPDSFETLEVIVTSPNASLIEQHKQELEPFFAYLNDRHNNRLKVTVATTNALLEKIRRTQATSSYPKLLATSASSSWTKPTLA